MRIFDYFSMVSSPSLVLAHLQSRSKLRIELDAPKLRVVLLATVRPHRSFACECIVAAL